MTASMTATDPGPPLPATDHTKNTTAIDDKLQDPPRALYSWRLHMSVLGLSLSLFFSALETTIISTALTTIGQSFHDFGVIGWVVTAYLVTYSSFFLTYSKLTDIFGQRNCLLFALVWFSLFSGLCGGAEKMSLTTLIVFRALQGIGGSGIYSVVFVTIVDICPARLVGPYSAVVSSTFAIANVLGPIVGGAICSSGDWKWIFLLNVPGSALALVVVFLSLPGGDGCGVTRAHLRRIDVVGSFLSIACAVLLLYGLQTGGLGHPWSNAQIIATLAAGGAGIFLFFGWEAWRVRQESLRSSPVEPILPLRLLARPKVALLLLSAFFQGCVFYAVVINTPQLNQIVHLSTATMAGVRTLPILLPMTFASFVSGVILSKTLRFGWHMLAGGSMLTVLGVGLLIEVPFHTSILARNYGFEVLLGVGIGFTMATFLIMGRVEVQDRDNAVIMGSVNMMRTMGGCIALSGVQAILHSQLPHRLSFLPASLVTQLVDAPTAVLKTLSEAESLEVRRHYNDVYCTGFIMVTALGGAAVVVSTIPVFLDRRRSFPEKENSVVVGSDPMERMLAMSETGSRHAEDEPRKICHDLSCNRVKSHIFYILLSLPVYRSNTNTNNKTHNEKYDT